MSLVAATRSEITKQFTTAIWWILAIVLVAYVGFVSSAVAAALGASAAGLLPSDRGPAIPTADVAASVYSTATSVGYVFPLLIGTLVVTTEFRHRTLTPTLLAVPRRSRVLIAKLVVGAILGLGYGVLAAIAAVAPGAGILAAFGLGTGLDQTDTWAMIARMLLASVLWALIGVGVGSTVRNQVATIVIVLVFTQFVEPVGRVIGGLIDGLSDWLRFLPGGAADALVGSSILVGVGGSSAQPLEWWAGALVLLGYALLFLVIGGATTWRRDVD